MGATGSVFGQLMEAFNRAAYARAFELLKPMEKDSFLEIGCGAGALLSLITPKIEDGLIAGTDPSAQILETAKARLKGFRVDLRPGHAASIPWPDATFNKAAAIHSFHFWSDPQAACEEIKRVLKPEGLLLLILRKHDPSRNPERLANPISRMVDQAAGAISVLEGRGFHVERHPSVGTSVVLTAVSQKSIG